MKEFRVHFQRYKSVTMTISSMVTIHAEEYDDAYRRATDMLTGMRNGDPEALFEINSLSQVGVRGEPVPMGGPSIFEPYVAKEEDAR